MAFKKPWSEFLENRDGSEYGIWVIRGEDENCGLSGPHFMPKIATCEGTLENVCKYAVTLNTFWSWGSGGDIKALTQSETIIKVNEQTLNDVGFVEIDENAIKIAEIDAQILALEKQKETINILK